MKNQNNQKMHLRFVDDEDERIFTVYADHKSLISLVRSLVDSGLVFVTTSIISDIEDNSNNPL